MKIQFTQSKEILLTTYAGLASIGALLSHTHLPQRLNRSVVKGMNTPIHSNRDPVFQTCLDLRKVPSSPTLRQRLDAEAQTIVCNWNETLLQESADLIRKVKAPVTGLEAGEHTVIPLDIDVSPFDNSGTQKEGISLTYKGTVGYAPIFAYLGQEGYGVNVELREGSTHSQKDGAAFLEESIHYARRITSERLLVRMDSGYDSLENLHVCHPQDDVYYLVKVNLHNTPKDIWLRIAEDTGMACEQREGKTEYIGFITFPEEGFDRPLRQVFQVIVRTIDKEGQVLLFPDIEVNVYWTSLTCAPWRVIMLYRDHGTSEQFHSELKTDLDL